MNDDPNLSPPPLGYGSSRAEPPSAAVQLFAGIGAWAVVVASAWVAGAMGAPSEVVMLALFAAFLVLVASGAALLNKYAWKAFLPGVIIGLGLTCLIPLGIMAVWCAMGHQIPLQTHP